jgi:hypothetical protein
MSSQVPLAALKDTPLNIRLLLSLKKMRMEKRAGEVQREDEGRWDYIEPSTKTELKW